MLQWDIFTCQGFSRLKVLDIKQQTNPIADTVPENLLTQLVNSPKKYRDSAIPSLLYLIITNSPESSHSIQNLPALGASDHLCIASTHLLSLKPNNTVIKKSVDYKGIYKELQETEWEKMIMAGNIEKSWTKFKKILLQIERLIHSD